VLPLKSAGRTALRLSARRVTPRRAFDEPYCSSHLIASQVASASPTQRRTRSSGGRAEALAEIDRAKIHYLQRQPRVPHARSLMLWPVEDMAGDPHSGHVRRVDVSMACTTFSRFLLRLPLGQRTCRRSRIEPARRCCSGSARRVCQEVIALAPDSQPPAGLGAHIRQRPADS